MGRTTYAHLKKHRESNKEGELEGRLEMAKWRGMKQFQVNRSTDEKAEIKESLCHSKNWNMRGGRWGVVDEVCVWGGGAKDAS